MEREYYKDDIAYRTSKAIEQWKHIPPEKIGEEFIEANGQIEIWDEYYRGAYPQLGLLILPEQGLSGDWETVQRIQKYPTVATINVYGKDIEA